MGTLGFSTTVTALAAAGVGGAALGCSDLTGMGGVAALGWAGVAALGCGVSSDIGGWSA